MTVSLATWPSRFPEGLVEAVRSLLRDSLTSTITSKVGALLARKAFTNFGRKLDYSEYGGAPLLGIKGVAIVGHGASNANAIKNAIRVAMQYHESGINSRIEEGLRPESGGVGRGGSNYTHASIRGTAFLFPGQGSQENRQSGRMGKELAALYPVARHTFQEADDALGFSISSFALKVLTKN